MLRILLPLLLCLTLIASTIGSVWAATTMAMPMPVAAHSGGAQGCHDVLSGMHATDSHADHGMPASLCGDGKHCDCVQHCNVMPTAVLPLLADIPRSSGPVSNDAGLASLGPGRLIRPPIA